MNTAVSQERLIEILDQVVRETMQRMAGIRLRYSDTKPEGDLATVYIVFGKGYHTCLSLCAEMPMLFRLTGNMMQREEVTMQDVELFTKEYFNVLCGHVATQLYQITRIPARFGVPIFCRGRYMPEDRLEQMILTYSSDKNENAQLVHHTLSVDHTEQVCQA